MAVDDLLQLPFTRDPVRRSVYPDDIYFRETAALLEQWDDEQLDRMLCRSSFVMFKPDAVVGRRIEPALAFLADHGFQVLGCAVLELDPRIHRELWRYQLNAAPLAVVRTVDLILESGPCLLVALRHEGTAAPGETAPGLLAELKGSSGDRGKQGAGAATLRTVLGCELLCLNFVHAPDDPADLVRELGVLLPRPVREAVLAVLAAEEPPPRAGADVLDAARRLYAAHPAHPLDPGAAPVPEALRRPGRLSGPELSAALDALGDPGDPRPRWDRIVIAAQLVEGLPAERRPLIGPPPGARNGHRARKAAGKADASGVDTVRYGPVDWEGPPRRYGPVERVAVLSDTHGNVAALAAVLAEPEVRAADLVVLCGDLTWGPEPQATYELIAGLGERALCVRGNGDRYAREIASGVRQPAPDRPRERWIPDRHSAEAMAFLAAVPFGLVVEIETLGTAFFCHGSPRSDHELVTPGTSAERFAELAGSADASVGAGVGLIVTGHTHLQFDRTVAGRRSVGPGSVGLPYHSGEPGTAYWTLLGPGIAHRSTRYDVTEAVERARRSGDPGVDRYVSTLLDPPTPEEIIADAEARLFAN
ncbi:MULTISPECIES: metallophosphoesterase family protein [Streptacidiphilus]|uniref:Metallophosphoesterase family protein n=1 Tax=Streptacidiphilus cavernicola TaxID=3342716 RepID=A0ABV6URN1_9ACTN|nr:metallophosphoesterase family protein [Streptacidiphilus jeojiense]